MLFRKKEISNARQLKKVSNQNSFLYNENEETANFQHVVYYFIYQQEY